MRLTPLDAFNAAALGLARPPAGREELAAAQLRALRASLARAREQSPFYRERLAGLAAGFPAAPDDLAGLPFTTPEELAARPEAFLAVSQSRVARVVTLPSSGTSGPPKRVFLGEAELAATRAFFRKGMGYLMGGRGHALVLLPHATPDSVGDQLRRALAEAGLGFTGAWPPTTPPPGRARPPSQAAACWPAGGGLGRGRALGPGRWLRAFTGEYLPASLAARVEGALACPVYGHYGLTEIGWGGAVACEARAGAHCREGELWWEVVDPRDGRVLPDGAEGELVVTTLAPRAMPLIRYRTGDWARLEGGRCACGGLSLRLAGLRGRLEAPRLAGGAALESSALDEVLFALPGLADYRASLLAGRPERLAVDYLATPGRGDPAPAIPAALAGVPALGTALADGTLALEPPRRVEGSAIFPGAKRIIQDLREQGAMSCGS